VTGIGLEDLEGSERFFSKSNALAGSLRHASTFHRRQKIHQFVRHMDAFDTSQNLSQSPKSSLFTLLTQASGKFLVNNYKQALNILEGKTSVRDAMVAREVTPENFRQWLQDEREYLKSLKTEPLEETLQMEYYQKLVNMDDTRSVLPPSCHDSSLISEQAQTDTIYHGLLSALRPVATQTEEGTGVYRNAAPSRTGEP
jgi:Kyakuja-Dileera-Zisupton transposase